MDSLRLLHRGAAYPNPKQVNNGNGYCGYIRESLDFSRPFTSQNLSLGLRKSVIVGARKKTNNKKGDTHSFFPKPDEATGPFPEAVLLKEKKVQEDGKLLPEFADVEEEKLYEFLNLELESQLKVDRMRHYEVVYLIHEKHAEEVESVNEKVQEFLREKKGKIWRLNDWGMRRLAYKIQKAKWINDFRSMLDKDGRVIRHLVIKRDEAITEDCPPPPEFHTLRAGMDDNDDEDDLEFVDEEDWDSEDEMEGYEDDVEDGIIIINEDDNDDDGDNGHKSAPISDKGGRDLIREKVCR